MRYEKWHVSFVRLLYCKRKDPEFRPEAISKETLNLFFHKLTSY